MTYLAVDSVARVKSEWEWIPLRRLARIRREANSDSSSVLLALSSDRGIEPRPDDGGRQLPSESTIEGYWRVYPNDLVFNPMWAIGGGVAVSSIEGAVSTAYRIYKLGPLIWPRFLHYWLRSEPAVNQYKLLVRGITTFDRSITRDDLESMPMPVPDIRIQRSIACYLDRETARIDALIAKKRHLIDLVEEGTLARVYAGIRGLQESGMRKFSGLMWLGDIPESWPVMPVGAQFEVLLGKMLDQNRVTGEYLKPYLRNTNVQLDRVDTDDLLLMDFPPYERLRYQVLPGDLLVCEGGEPGRAAVWDGRIPEIYYQKALHRVRARGHSSARWLFYCLRAAVALNVFAVEGNTTTIAHLTGEQLRAHRFPFPGRSTQERLVRELDKQARRNERLLRLVRVQIDRLDEHRQALIAAAVTGQIDVPEAT